MHWHKFELPAPVVAVFLFASQLVHSPVPSLDLYFPTGQREHDPVMNSWPAGQDSMVPVSTPVLRQTKGSSVTMDWGIGSFCLSVWILLFRTLMASLLRTLS